MKTLVYFKLSNLPWPQEILEWLKVGDDYVPLVYYFTGEIEFEYPFDGHLNIIEADKAYLEATKAKKLSSATVCYVKEFPTGGWA